MKIMFAGTPEFAAVALEALYAAGHEITLVLTQPDRPAGRGMQLQASPVKQCAIKHGTPVAQPVSLRLNGKYPEVAQEAHALLQSTPHDVMVVAAYGLILPRSVLDIPRLGCINIHGSLLPRWRGAAPIHRAIEAGDAETGITIMQMEEGLDTGPMMLIESLPIAEDDTTGSLHDKLAALGGKMIVEAIARLEQGTLPAAAGRRGQLRRQDRQGGGRARLHPKCRAAGPPHPRLQSLPRRDGALWRYRGQAVAGASGQGGTAWRAGPGAVGRCPGRHRGGLR